MKRAAAVTLLLCWSALAVAQGLHWQQRTTGGPGGDRTSDSYAMPRKFKSVDAADGRVMIVRLDREVIWTIDTKKRTYQEMTFAQLEQMANTMSSKMKEPDPKMDEARAEMEREMANMPEEQRKMMEKMMGGKIPGMGSSAPIEVEKTNETRTISGYNCKKYVMRRGDETFSTLWVTKDVREFAPLMADWREFSKRLASLQQLVKGMGEAYAKIDGFIVQTTMSIMGQEITTTTTRVERASPAASEFDVPSGYTKTASDLDKAMQQMDKE